MRLAVSGFIFLLLVAGCLTAQVVNPSINTISSWNGSQFISSFGVTDTATYGQTLTLASSGLLNNFSFEIGNCGAQVTFRGEVYAWDGTKATGPALWEGAPQTLPNSSAFALVTMSPGVTLTPGQYVIFVSTSKDQSGAPSSACRFGAVTNTAYSGGLFVFMNNTANPALWTTNTWSTISEDLAMYVTINGYPPPGTPLPSSFPLVVIGLIALGVAGRALMPASRN